MEANTLRLVRPVVPHEELSEDEKLKRAYRWGFKGIYGMSVNKSRAARILECSRRTVYNMIADGRLVETFDGQILTDSIFDLICDDKTFEDILGGARSWR